MKNQRHRLFMGKTWALKTRALKTKSAAIKVSIAALTTLLVLVFSGGALAEARGVAFHLDTDEHMNRAIRQVSRHLEANPDIPLRVILIAGAVHAAEEGATDPNGGLYSAQMEQLLAKGVRIFACENTMNTYNLTMDDLTFGIETVPSGVAELGRLQIELNYAYIKL